MIRIGEIGKRIVVITSYDMSSNTSLAIKAVPPSGEGNQKTWTATIGSTALNNIVLEDGTSVTSVSANQWMYYDLEAASDIDEAGEWTLVGVYTNTSTTPDEVFISNPITVTVLDDNFAA